jgi:hypothetical protein
MPAVAATAKPSSQLTHGVLALALLLSALAFLRLAAAGLAARHAAPPAPGAPPTVRRAPAAPAVFTVSYLNSSQTAGPYPADFSCFDANNSPLSCSPSWCASSPRVTPAASVRSCEPTSAQAAPLSYTSLVSGTSCSSCTVSSDARCTAASLTATFGPYPSVLAAYCNDAYLIMLTTTAGVGTYSLDQVPNPPGGTDASGACKTRAASLTQGWKVNAWPLNPTLYASSSLSNNAGFFAGTPNGDNGPLTNGTTTFWLSASGRVGVTLSGQEIFPVFNNRALFTAENCEADACNAHIGQGLGQPHLHGDPFGPAGQCFYSAANYTNSAGAVDWSVHPPLIGIAEDGLWIYGRHLSSSAPGASTALDVCGGHAHGSLGYHYHTQILAAFSSGSGSGTSTAGLPYPQTSTGPLYCYRGDLSANAWYGKKGPGAPGGACCGATAAQYYVRAGYTLSLTAGAGGASPSAAPGGGTAAAASSSALSAGAIAGIAIGSAAAVAAIITGAICAVRVRRDAAVAAAHKPPPPGISV